MHAPPHAQQFSQGQAIYEPFSGSGRPCFAAELTTGVCATQHGARPDLRRCARDALAELHGSRGDDGGWPQFREVARRTGCRVTGGGGGDDLRGMWGSGTAWGEQRFTGRNCRPGIPLSVVAKPQSFLGFLRVRSTDVTEFSRQTRGFVRPSSSNECPRSASPRRPGCLRIAGTLPTGRRVTARRWTAQAHRRFVREDRALRPGLVAN